MRALSIDLDVMHWPLTEQFAYREKVGVTAQYAMAVIQRESGSPDDLAALNIPPEYLFGFVWIAERRKDKAVTFEGLAAELDYDALIDAFNEAVTVDEPDPTSGETDSPASPTSSPSARTTAGRRAKS